jgi:hypothetical protein
MTGSASHVRDSLNRSCLRPLGLSHLSMRVIVTFLVPPSTISSRRDPARSRSETSLPLRRHSILRHQNWQMRKRSLRIPLTVTKAKSLDTHQTIDSSRIFSIFGRWNRSRPGPCSSSSNGRSGTLLPSFRHVGARLVGSSSHKVHY